VTIVVKQFEDLINEGVLQIGDGYRAKNNELTGGGEIFLRAGQVSDSHISFDGVERFGEQYSGAVAKKKSQAGDTVVTTKGNSTGRTAYVTEKMPAFVYSPHLCFWRSTKPNELDAGYLRY